jgi:hypothetical protein
MSRATMTIFGLLLALAPVVAQQPCDPLFPSTPEGFEPIGRSPEDLAVADFDGDGDLDLALPSRLDPILTLFFNDGDGGFGPAVRVDAVDRVLDIAACDVDGDGDADIILMTSLGAIAVLRNDGRGSFGPQVIYGVSSPTDGMDVGDIDLDGDTDVVVVGRGPGGMAVLRNNGAGEFAFAYAVAVPDDPFRVALGDFNNDGAPDAVVVDEFEERAHIIMNNGRGLFILEREYPCGPTNSSPVDVQTGDLDGDGLIDIVVANDGFAPNVSVLRSGGGGFFIARDQYDAGPAGHTVTLADVNADGSLDVVASMDLGNAMGILLNSGDGTLGLMRSYGVGDRPQKAVAGDFDRDGIVDLALAAYNPNRAMILEGFGDGTLPLRQAYDVPDAFAIASADIDGDGLSDVATLGRNPPGVVTHFGDGGSLRFGRRYSGSQIGREPRAMQWADIDGDGSPDLVVLAIDAPRVSVLLNDGLGTLALGILTDLPHIPSLMAVADMDRDGLLDVVTISEDSGVALVCIGDGSGAFPIINTFAAVEDGFGPQAADLNGDGWLDVVFTSRTFGDSFLHVMLNDGAGGLLPPSSVASPAMEKITLLDVTGDGLIDAITSDLGPTHLLVGQGDGAFMPPLEIIDRRVEAAQVGDVDGDGLVDIVGSISRDAVGFYPGLGGGQFGPGQLFQLGDNEPADVALGDANGDGRTDIFCVRQTALSLLLNGEACVSRCRADIDGDGQLTLFDFLAFQNEFQAGCE